MIYDLLIKNGYICNNSGNIINGDIAIKDGIICEIKSKINVKAKEIIDATNSIILPGFINTHIHFGEYYLKGYKGKLTTSEYIDYAEKFNFNNLELKEKIRTTSSKICAYEAIKYGQTTLMGIRGWNCLEQFKIRLYMGYPLMNSIKLKEYLNNPFIKFESYKQGNLSKTYIFIHSLLMVDEKILYELSKYIQKKNIYIAVHLLETEIEELKIQKKYHLSSLEVLEKYNLLSEKTLLVHCCYISDEDIKIIRKYRCSISINPNSNFKLKNIIPNIKKLDGINICIGTDGVATNDSLNILDSVRTLGLISDLSDSELFNMITLNPGKFLANKTGTIEKGFRADINIYDINNYKIVRKDTFINNLIYSSDIIPKYVIVDGKLIINNYNNFLYTYEEICKENISDRLFFNN